MARISLASVDALSPEQRQQYDKFPSNLTKGLLLLEPRLAQALPNLANAIRASGLVPKLREGLILRVAALSNSAYERMQHIGEAHRSGWSTTEIAAIQAGDFHALPEEYTPVMKFVDECVACPRVSDTTFANAKEILSERDLATILLLVGHYMMVARFTASLDIELDDRPSDWKSEH